MDGLIEMNGMKLVWRLISEPQFTSEDGYRGICISVVAKDGRHRELELQFPMPDKTTGNTMPQLPQRPKFSEKDVEAGVIDAIASGWDPESRGKVYRHEMRAVGDEKSSKLSE
ncbi:MAG: hypothetical protein V4555_08000 [Acidobacteriota bacterium]